MAKSKKKKPTRKPPKKAAKKSRIDTPLEAGAASTSLI
jgi:hypothetical protein